MPETLANPFPSPSFENPTSNPKLEPSTAIREVTDGSLKYTLELGNNDSPPSYQEASGAPVERHSPLGYEVGAATIIFLNVSKMIGTGIYSTRRSLLPTLLLPGQ
jgi:hypothetical protein